MTKRGFVWPRDCWLVRVCLVALLDGVAVRRTPETHAHSTVLRSFTHRSSCLAFTTAPTRAAALGFAALVALAPARSCEPQYAQCGGKGWIGGTVCCEGSCRRSGDYYSQCPGPSRSGQPPRQEHTQQPSTASQPKQPTFIDALVSQLPAVPTTTTELKERWSRAAQQDPRSQHAAPLHGRSPALPSVRSPDLLPHSSQSVHQDPHGSPRPGHRSRGEHRRTRAARGAGWAAW